MNGSNVAGRGDNIQLVGSNNTIAATSSAAGSSVFGSGNTVNATNAVVMGNNSTVSGASSVAIGNGTGTTGINAIAMGTGAGANFDNSVAIGSGATTTRSNQVAVGTASSTYTMSGITSAASKAAQSGPTQLVTSDAAGNLATTSLAGLGLASAGDISGINSQLAALNGRVDNLTRESRGGVALALAASSLQFDPRPGKISVSGGFGNFQGQSGLAVGLGYSYSDAMRFNAAFTAAQQGAIGVRAGASWTLN
ncbi:YadA-like family protein [Bradyrhizobium diazoefficiens]|uniref:YadA-like family protein n=1 Tax=Bradyrhizobium diazoefficiens TaxID=1355477 RepID=UPI002B466071|nr:YadA-like family protein [Bradyrhizobium diazoefficiens]WRJ12225.1 YadA-like family protein [Bradyrhizobium diazoefficiens]